MAIHETVRKHCPECDKDVDFEIKMCLVDNNGIIPCYKCPECGIVVPAYSFHQFLEDGRLHIYV